MKKIIAFMCALIVGINSMSLTVSATSTTEESTESTVEDTTHGGGGSARPSDKTDLTGFKNWSLSDQFQYFRDNILSVIGGVCGVFVNPLNWEYSYISDQIQQYAYDASLVSDSADYWEWVANCLSVDDSGNLTVNDELADALYQSINVYIEENCGWYEYQTFIPSDMATVLDNKVRYDYIVSEAKKLEAGQILIVDVYSKWWGSYAIDTNSTVLATFDYDGIVLTGNISTKFGELYNDWEYATGTLSGITSSGITLNSCSDLGYNETESGTVVMSSPNICTFYYPDNWTGGSYYYAITNSRQTVRVYKTYDDYKQYSVNNRPYYTTSKFTEYELSGDNSCVISQSDLSNGSVYGDVVNNIITIYEDADGLTEDELRAILDEYFDNLDGGGSSGSGDSDSGSSSGGGLFDFIDGLGSIGDALLSILGKLLEYVGKAIDLLSGTVTKIIDLIPQNITNLISGLFPFIPEEWLTAIELSLVLAVIVGVVGIFKK